jgi:PAS domain S-box-containing protein
MNNDHFYEGNEFQRFFRTAKRSLVLKANSPVFTVLAASDLYLELTHKNRNEVLGKGLFDVYPGNHADPTEKDSVFSSFTRVIETGMPDELPLFKYEITVEGSLQKETHYWTNENEPILDDNGEVAYIINTTTNITEKIRQSHALQESEDRFRIMAEGTDVMIAVGNKKGESIYYNHAWEVATGRTVEDLLQRGWIELVHHDDREQTIHTFNLAYQNKEPWTWEFRMQTEHVGFRWLLTNGVPRFSKGGEFVGYISSSVDITSRKSAELELQLFNERLEKEVNDRTAELKNSRDQLQSILDTTLLQIAFLEANRDANGSIIDFKIKSANKALEKLTGRTDLVGRFYAIEFPGIREVGIFDLIEKTIETGQPQQMEYFYLHEGFKNWFSSMFVKLNDGVVATTLDITSHKMNEEKIRKLETDQHQEIVRVSFSTLEEERHRISESLHNGLGQILYGIKLNVSGLRQEIPAENFKKNKAYINELLTDAIRDTRQISHDLMPATLEQFGLKSAILDICLQLSEGTKFRCSIKESSRGVEKYLELAIYRTVQELMTNVVKHAKATECEVNVRIEPEKIRIIVSDNGKGMTDKPKQWPGIGLAAIQSKIKLLNGHIHIESIPDRGTKIDIIIPQSQSGNGI